MKSIRLAAVAAAAAALLGLSGCASMQSPPMEVDKAYVAYVEAAAKQFGTQVIWVNYPMRPVRTEQTQTPATAPK